MDVVLVEVENQSAEVIFVTIDNTGRMGKDVKPDLMKKLDGTGAPPGLLIKPKNSRSFGEAIGLFDAPTLHGWKVKDDQNLAENDASSSEKFSPADFIKIGVPKLEVKFIDGKFSKK